MFRIQRIVCPVDFSEGSEQALRYAADLAKSVKASVFLLHAHELSMHWVPPGIAYEAEQPGAPFDIARVKQELQSKLGDLEAQVAQEGIEARANLVLGAPADAILEHAASVDADLIVMGTHGRTGLDRLVLGSVAERVVRLSKCPVLTVRSGKPE